MCIYIILYIYIHIHILLDSGFPSECSINMHGHLFFLVERGLHSDAKIGCSFSTFVCDQIQIQLSSLINTPYGWNRAARARRDKGKRRHARHHTAQAASQRWTQQERQASATAPQRTSSKRRTKTKPLGSGSARFEIQRVKMTMDEHAIVTVQAQR